MWDSGVQGDGVGNKLAYSCEEVQHPVTDGNIKAEVPELGGQTVWNYGIEC